MGAAAAPSTRDRALIPAEYKWNVSLIFPSWTAWEEEYKTLEPRMAELAALKGTLSRGTANVVAALEQRDEIDIVARRLFRYAQLQRDVDARDRAAAEHLEQLQTLLARSAPLLAWLDAELVTIPEPQMQAWIEATPSLQSHRFPLLDLYRRRKHIIDGSGQPLVPANADDLAPLPTYQKLMASIPAPTFIMADGRRVLLTPEGYRDVLTNSKRTEERARATELFQAAYRERREDFAQAYREVLERELRSAKGRNYPNSLAAALDANAIPRELLTDLLKTVREGTEPLRNYMRLRARVLGLKDYHLYDNLLPLSVSRAAYPYERGRELVLAAVAPLGEDYQAKMATFLSSGRVDLYPNDGKRIGAYTAMVPRTGPYVLTNYNDTLDAVFTLAHEVGHAAHAVLSYENQPYPVADCSTFIAEIASTLNERLLLEFMLASATGEERIALLQHSADMIVWTFYTQALCADFELQSHQRFARGQHITADTLDTLFGQLLRDYYGDSARLNAADNAGWIHAPHLFSAPFYVFQYSTSAAASVEVWKTLTSDIDDLRIASARRHLNLLEAGGNGQPLQQLRSAKVNFAMQAVVTATVDAMNRNERNLGQTISDLVPKPP